MARIGFLTLSIVCLALPAFAAPMRSPIFDTGPATEARLRELDNAQLRLLRRAVRSCVPPSSVHPINPERDPCVIASADNAVESSGDSDLKTFHRSLPMNARYDENRSTIVWRAWLQQ